MFFSKDGTFLDFHAHDPKELVFPPHELIGKTFREIGLSSQTESDFEAGIRRVLETSSIQTFEYSLSLPKGTRIFEARMVSIDQERVLAIVRDVSDLRHAKAMLSHREKTLLEIQQIAHIASFKWNLAKDSIEWAEEFLYIAEREPGSSPSTGKGFLSLIIPADRERVMEEIEAAWVG